MPKKKTFFFWFFGVKKKKESGLWAVVRVSERRICYLVHDLVALARRLPDGTVKAAKSLKLASFFFFAFTFYRFGLVLPDKLNISTTTKIHNTWTLK